MFGPDKINMPDVEIYTFNVRSVQYYPYRTALVCPIIRMKESVIPDLRERLAARCGGQKDNHTVYVVNDDLAIEFSDGYINIGGISAMKEKRW